MKIDKVDGQTERRLLTAMVTSTDFLSQACSVIDLDLIDNPNTKLVAQWCIEYFNEYGKAPHKDIETTYHAWVESHPSSSDLELVHDLLEQLSDSYDDHDPINVPYMMDALRTFLQRKKLEKLREDIDYSLQTGQEDEAQQYVTSFQPIEISAGLGIDPLHDYDAWKRAFATVSKPLFTFPGSAGTFFNHALTRDSLIGIQGPEKRGKTFWCIEFVARAIAERRRVAFFQVGDLSEGQVLIRLGMYWAMRPSRQDLCGHIKVPDAIHKPTSDDADDLSVDYHTKHCRAPLTFKACGAACRKVMRQHGLNPNKCYLKVSVHSNSSINVRGIEAILAQWEMTEGFIPDVIVIDYADILAPEDPREQPRDQANATWKALRRLSQERRCLVISPTQADADSYGRRTQTMRNFSEDKRKLAHVTGMIGLNQTETEKEWGVMRLNWLVLRESPYNSARCLWVGQCLSLGRAYFCSTF